MMHEGVKDIIDEAIDWNSRKKAIAGKELHCIRGPAVIIGLSLMFHYLNCLN